jgi:tyrosyl-tRNA synthetase
MAHKDAFGQGTNTFSLQTIRNTLSSLKSTYATSPTAEPPKNKDQHLLAYKQSYVASTTQSMSSSPTETPKSSTPATKIVTLPLSLLHPGSFPRILVAAGLASSKSEAHRLIANKGAYVVVPNSGTTENPTALKWATIEAGAAVDPNQYLVDWEALALRVGKAKIQLCRVVRDEVFVEEGLTCVGWDRNGIEGAVQKGDA